LDVESTYFQLVSGQRSGPVAGVLRGGLHAAAGVYGAAISVRNFYYGRWAFPAWLDVPVISVGNLTVGGTGKTPMTIWLCERLLERGRKPAVLSRGYKSEQGTADELLLVSRRVPRAVAIANPNRVAAGHLAVQEYQVGAAVLDDGFQHRRMGRDLDIVLVDATRPFGFGHLLPRGLLREPVNSLRRAEAVVVTRADQCEAHALGALERTIRSIHPDVPIVRAIHRPAGFWSLSGERAEVAPGARVGAFAGIARPDAFLRTLESVGHAPAAVQWFPDHHVYAPHELKELTGWAQREQLDLLVTTEKDAVKLHHPWSSAEGPSRERVAFEWPTALRVLRVDMALLGDGDKILTGLIDTMLKDHEEPDDRPAAE
jgi:tetraacyldisaccharide 4'-kinase